MHGPASSFIYCYSQIFERVNTLDDYTFGGYFHEIIMYLFVDSEKLQRLFRWRFSLTCQFIVLCEVIYD